MVGLDRPVVQLTIKSGRPLSCMSLMKERGNTPTTDTISHFPSPGGEALNHDYKPYKPLIHEDVEVRASSSQTFQHNLKTKMLEYQNTSKYTSGNVAHEELPEHFYRSQVKIPANVIKKAALEACYKTSTQKLYEGMDSVKVAMRHKPAPINLHLVRSLWSASKPESFKEKPETWQNVVSTWDRVQFRAGSLSRRVSLAAFVVDGQGLPKIL